MSLEAEERETPTVRGMPCADTDTEGRQPYEEGDRDWNCAAASQGTAMTAGGHQKLGKRSGTESPSELLKRTSSANSLILDFWPPKV